MISGGFMLKNNSINEFAKSEFILDELYSADTEYPRKGSEIDRFLYYRKKGDDIDADVCKKNLEMYCKNNPELSSELEIVLQPKINKSKMKYQIIKDGQKYRGETLVNCMQLLLQIVNYENPIEKIVATQVDEIKELLQKSKILKENNGLKEKLNVFVRECYGAGNFFAIPFVEGASLNTSKGKLKEYGYNFVFSDSSYTYLKVCAEYFIEGRNICQLTKRIDEKYPNMKELYSGKKGFETFVSNNKFNSFFENGKPIKFWNNTGDFIKDLNNYLDLAICALSTRRLELVP